MSDDALAGRVALVTGATSGIGEATARRFAERGAHVVVVGRRADRGEAVVADIGAAGGEATYVQTDVSDAGQIDQMVARTVEIYGGLDYAFNNAGIFDRMSEFHLYSDESWDEMIAVNLTAVFRCMRAQIAAMLELGQPPRGGRSIVNCASTVAHRGSERASPAYVAGKHAVVGLTRQAALEYVTRGIHVNAVSPGPTLTAVAQPLMDEGPDAVRDALLGLNPRAEFVAADDVAEAVLFLCTPSAAMINGHDIPLDGGQLAKL